MGVQKTFGKTMVGQRLGAGNGKDRLQYVSALPRGKQYANNGSVLVQTKGKIDSLLLNLLKTLNSPEVQGMIAVSDPDQLATIKKQAALVGDLNKKIKYRDYQRVFQIHEALRMVNKGIDILGLVPQGFYHRGRPVRVFTIS